MRRLHPSSLSRRVPRPCSSLFFTRPALPPLSFSTPRPYSTPVNPSSDPAPSSDQNASIDKTPQPKTASAKKVQAPKEPQYPTYESFAFKAYRPKAAEDKPIPAYRPILSQALTSFAPPTQILSFDDRGPSKSPLEHVLVLVTPVEGGETYLSDCIEHVGSQLSADVVELFTPLAIGMDGPASPMAAFGWYRSMSSEDS